MWWSRGNLGNPIRYGLPGEDSAVGGDAGLLVAYVLIAGYTELLTVFYGRWLVVAL